MVSKRSKWDTNQVWVLTYARECAGSRSTVLVFFSISFPDIFLSQKNSPFSSLVLLCFFVSLQNRKEVLLAVKGLTLAWLHPQNHVPIVTQPINRIRVWGIGLDNDRYVWDAHEDTPTPPCVAYFLLIFSCLSPLLSNMLCVVFTGTLATLPGMLPLISTSATCSGVPCQPELWHTCCWRGLGASPSLGPPP